MMAAMVALGTVYMEAVTGLSCTEYVALRCTESAPLHAPLEDTELAPLEGAAMESAYL